MFFSCERSGVVARIFVPLCASFVPWSFWRPLVIIAGILSTHWFKTYFSVELENASLEMKKPARGGLIH
jgi:hypothetical protein